MVVSFTLGRVAFGDPRRFLILSCSLTYFPLAFSHASQPASFFRVLLLARGIAISHYSSTVDIVDDNDDDDDMEAAAACN